MQYGIYDKLSLNFWMVVYLYIHTINLLLKTAGSRISGGPAVCIKRFAVRICIPLKFLQKSMHCNKIGNGSMGCPKIDMLVQRKLFFCCT